MAIEEKQITSEEQKKESANVKELGDKLTDSLLSTLDLPGDEEQEEEKDQVKEEAEAEDSADENQDEETDSENSKKEEDEEDFIPKDKFQKRLASERNKIRVLEAKLAELEERTKSPSNSTRDRLESMSEAELKDLKSQVRLEWKGEEDIQRARQLDNLLDEIDDVLRSAPEKFSKRQIDEYNKTARAIAEDNEDIDFTKHAEEIKNLAVDIYRRYPDLHKLVKGQATALELAFDHWKTVKRQSSGKSREMELKRQNLKLKQKTALDSGTVKGKVNVSADRRKSYERAKAGGFQDKVDHIFKHVLDIDKLVPEVSGK